MRSATFVVVGLAIVCTAGGCGASALEVTQRELAGRVSACLADEPAGEIRLVARPRDGRLELSAIEGLSADEEACVRDLVGRQEVTASIGDQLRFRGHRELQTDAMLSFLRQRRAEVAACRPCPRTRVIATPAGDHYELEAAIVGGELELEPTERECITAALAGMPRPAADARKAVAVYGGACE